MEDQERRSIMGGAGISRRALLGAAAASCSALTFGTPFVRRALAEEPVRVGVVIAKQGAFVQQGADLAAGLQLALKEANNTAIGRNIEREYARDGGGRKAQRCPVHRPECGGTGSDWQGM